VVAIFVMLYGFDRVVLPLGVLQAVEVVLCFYFFTEKVIRFFNAESKLQFLRFNWFEIPLLLVLLLIAGGADRWFPLLDRDVVLLPAVTIYLILQVLSKVCVGMVQFASSGRNPTKGLIILFIILICAGAGLLMLPKSHNLEKMSYRDQCDLCYRSGCRRHRQGFFTDGPDHHPDSDPIGRPWHRCFRGCAGAAVGPGPQRQGIAGDAGFA
jgi:hypothetical protein